MPSPPLSVTSTTATSGSAEFDHLHRLRRALRFAAGHQIRLIVDQLRETLAHDRVIVDEQHLGRLFGVSTPVLLVALPCSLFMNSDD